MPNARRKYSFRFSYSPLYRITETCLTFLVVLETTEKKFECILFTETPNESKRKSTFPKSNWPIHFLKSLKLYNTHLFVKNHYFSDLLKKVLLLAKFDTKLLLYYYVILIKDIFIEVSLNTKVVPLITVYFKWKTCSFSWVSS